MAVLSAGDAYGRTRWGWLRRHGSARAAKAETADTAVLICAAETAALICMNDTKGGLNADTAASSKKDDDDEGRSERRHGR